MKKFIIALLLVAIPVMVSAADTVVGSQKYFNIGNKRAVTAGVIVPNSAQSTGFTLAASSLGLNSVDYYSLQINNSSMAGLYGCTWDVSNSLLKVYIAAAADSTPTLIGTPTAFSLTVFAIGN